MLKNKINIKKSPMSIFINITLFVFILFLPLNDTFFEVSHILLNLTFLFLIIKNKELNYFLKYKKISMLFLLLFLSMTISNSLGNTELYGWKVQIKFFLRFPLLFFSLLYFLEKKYVSIGFILISATISMGLQAIDGLYQLTYGIDFIKQRPIIGRRLTASTFNPNPFGFLMMVGSILFFDQLNTISNNKKNIWFVLGYGFLFFISIFCMIYSGSRAAWIGFIVSMICYFIISFVYHKKNKNIFMISAASLCLFFVVVKNKQSVLNRLRIVFNGPPDLRYPIWQRAFEYIPEAPIFGHGIVENLIYLERGNDSINLPHNIYLEATIYLGLIGLIVLGMMLYKSLNISIKVGKHKPIYFALIISFLCNGFFDNSIFTAKIFLAPIFITLACLYIEYRLSFSQTKH